MKKFIIERRIPDAGKLSAEDLRTIARTSNAVIDSAERPYTWLESFVTDDKIYCIHEAESEEEVREHSKCGGFPVYSVQEIKTVIGPGTAD